MSPSAGTTLFRWLLQVFSLLLCFFNTLGFQLALPRKVLIGTENEKNKEKQHIDQLNRVSSKFHDHHTCIQHFQSDSGTQDAY